MIEIFIIAVGKIHKSLEAPLCTHYLEAILPLQTSLGVKNITVYEIAHSCKRSVKERLKDEADNIKKKFQKTRVLSVCLQMEKILIHRVFLIRFVLYKSVIRRWFFL